MLQNRLDTREKNHQASNQRVHSEKRTSRSILNLDRHSGYEKRSSNPRIYNGRTRSKAPGRCSSQPCEIFEKNGHPTTSTQSKFAIFSKLNKYSAPQVSQRCTCHHQFDDLPSDLSKECLHVQIYENRKCDAARRKRQTASSCSQIFYKNGNVECLPHKHDFASRTPDLFGRILGPTPDESILAGLQTVLDMCGVSDRTVPSSRSGSSEARCRRCSSNGLTSNSSELDQSMDATSQDQLLCDHYRCHHDRNNGEELSEGNLESTISGHTAKQLPSITSSFIREASQILNSLPDKPTIRLSSHKTESVQRISKGSPAHETRITKSKGSSQGLEELLSSSFSGSVERPPKVPSTKSSTNSTYSSRVPTAKKLTSKVNISENLPQVFENTSGENLDILSTPSVQDVAPIAVPFENITPSEKQKSARMSYQDLNLKEPNPLKKTPSVVKTTKKQYQKRKIVKRIPSDISEPKSEPKGPSKAPDRAKKSASDKSFALPKQKGAKQIQKSRVAEIVNKKTIERDMAKNKECLVKSQCAKKKVARKKEEDEGKRNVCKKKEDCRPGPCPQKYRTDYLFTAEFPKCKSCGKKSKQATTKVYQGGSPKSGAGSFQSLKNFLLGSNPSSPHSPRSTDVSSIYIPRKFRQSCPTTAKQEVVPKQPPRLKYAYIQTEEENIEETAYEDEEESERIVKKTSQITRTIHPGDEDNNPKKKYKIDGRNMYVGTAMLATSYPEFRKTENYEKRNYHEHSILSPSTPPYGDSSTESLEGNDAFYCEKRKMEMEEMEQWQTRALQLASEKMKSVANKLRKEQSKAIQVATKKKSIETQIGKGEKILESASRTIRSSEGPFHKKPSKISNEKFDKHKRIEHDIFFPAAPPYGSVSKDTIDGRDRDYCAKRKEEIVGLQKEQSVAFELAQKYLKPSGHDKTAVKTSGQEVKKQDRRKSEDKVTKSLSGDLQKSAGALEEIGDDDELQTPFYAQQKMKSYSSPSLTSDVSSDQVTNIKRIKKFSSEKHSSKLPDIYKIKTPETTSSSSSKLGSSEDLIASGSSGVTTKIDVEIGKKRKGKVSEKKKVSSEIGILKKKHDVKKFKTDSSLQKGIASPHRLSSEGFYGGQLVDDYSKDEVKISESDQKKSSTESPKASKRKMDVERSSDKKITLEEQMKTSESVSSERKTVEVSDLQEKISTDTPQYPSQDSSVSSTKEDVVEPPPVEDAPKPSPRRSLEAKSRPPVATPRPSAEGKISRDTSTMDHRKKSSSKDVASKISHKIDSKISSGSAKSSSVTKRREKLKEELTHELISQVERNLQSSKDKVKEKEEILEARPPAESRKRSRKEIEDRSSTMKLSGSDTGKIRRAKDTSSDVKESLEYTQMDTAVDRGRDKEEGFVKDETITKESTREKVTKDDKETKLSGEKLSCHLVCPPKCREHSERVITKEVSVQKEEILEYPEISAVSKEKQSIDQNSNIQDISFEMKIKFKENKIEAVTTTPKIVEREQRTTKEVKVGPEKPPLSIELSVSNVKREDSEESITLSSTPNQSEGKRRSVSSKSSSERGKWDKKHPAVEEMSSESSGRSKIERTLTKKPSPKRSTGMKGSYLSSVEEERFSSEMLVTSPTVSTGSMSESGSERSQSSESKPEQTPETSSSIESSVKSGSKVSWYRPSRESNTKKRKGEVSSREKTKQQWDKTEETGSKSRDVGRSGSRTGESQAQGKSKNGSESSSRRSSRTSSGANEKQPPKTENKGTSADCQHKKTKRCLHTLLKKLKEGQEPCSCVVGTNVTKDDLKLEAKECACSISSVSDEDFDEGDFEDQHPEEEEEEVEEDVEELIQTKRTVSDGGVVLEEEIRETTRVRKGSPQKPPRGPRGKPAAKISVLDPRKVRYAYCRISVFESCTAYEVMKVENLEQAKRKPFRANCIFVQRHRK